MLRQILAVVLVAAGLLFTSLSLAVSKKAELYLSYEQRVAITYALLAHGESSEVQHNYLDRAEKYFSTVAKLPVQTVDVANFDEFLKHFRGQWPDTQSVSLDLEMIEKDGPRAVVEYKSKSPKVQRQVEEYISWQMQQLKRIGESAKVAQGYLQSKDIMAKAMLLLQDPNGKTLAKNWLLQHNEALFKDRMQEFDRIGEKIATSEMAQSPDVSMRIVMQTMFTEYFARLSADSKKLIVSSFLGGNLNATDMQKFEIMVQNSGPQLQKLLQIVARQGDLSPEMTKVFKTLEDAVRPVPYRQVEAILEQENTNYKFLYFEKKPLGVGTMAQVHRAKILVNGDRKDVVVRFIKPDIEKRVEEDGRILKQVATILDSNPDFAKTGAPKLTPIVSDLTATVTAELSQEDTVARQKMAALRYNQTVFMKTPEYKNYIEFHVPTVYSSMTDKSKFMVQEMVIGKKLDKEVALWTDMAPQLKKGIVEELAKMWGREVLFGGGFYHSDLHQGNFMVRLTDEKIRVNILDFGMGGVISADLQRQVMMLGAGIEVQNPQLVAKAFWSISNKAGNEVTEQQFHSLVEARMNAGLTNPEDISIDGWTKWAMNQGLRLPYDFISLNRGIVIINKLLQDSGSSFSIANMIKSFALQNPFLVYRRLVIEENVSHADLFKLGLQEILKLGMGEKKQSQPIAVKAPNLSCELVFL